MRPVEREPERVERKTPRVEISAQEAFPFLRRFHIDDFPVGAFMVMCPVIGGASTFWTGSFLLALLQRYEPTGLCVWVLFGIAFGIGFGIKFINWLADNSPD